MKMKHSVYSSASLLASSLALASSNSIVSKNATVSDSRLQTWWHNNGEINYQSPVQEQNVRQSHVYSAWVKSDTASTTKL